MKVTKKAVLDNEITLRLSDISNNLAFKILSEYLFPGRLWKEEKRISDQIFEFSNIPSYAEKKPLLYNLCPSDSDEMYFTRSDKPGKDAILSKSLPENPEADLEEISQKELKSRAKKQKHKKVDPSVFSKTGTKTHDMRPAFISRLEHRGAKILFIPRLYIKEVIEMLVPELEAMIKSNIFPNQKLKTLGKSLGKYENRFSAMDTRTRKKLLTKAINSMITAYKDKEVEFYQKFLTSSEVDV